MIKAEVICQIDCLKTRLSVLSPVKKTQWSAEACDHIVLDYLIALDGRHKL